MTAAEKEGIIEALTEKKKGLDLMNTTELFVPLFVWLIGGSRIGGTYNTYYGSCTAQPENAAWGQKVFNYAVYIKKVEDREILKAGVYSGLQSYSAAAAADEVTEEAFPCEEESLPLVKAWLEEQRAAFFLDCD